jgi:glucose/arabinose dehydrogenase
VLVSDRFRPSGFIVADEPAALALTPDGDLLIGERRTGRIMAVTAAQLQTETPVATEFAQVDVATEGQQGLLGLVVLADGTVLAGMTRPDDDGPRQVVVSIAPGGRLQDVWIGPPAAPEAIGGRLALMADGRVLIGLGDFLRGKASSFDTDEPYSKLLSLDPAGPPDQEPVVVSEGWNNPFAFTVAPDGAVWVADNAPGEVPERIGRGDDRGPLTEMDVERAPSGLAVLGPDELAVCGVVSGLLELVPIVDGEAEQPTDVLAEPCELGVLALPGGGLAVAEYGGVTILTAG